MLKLYKKPKPKSLNHPLRNLKRKSKRQQSHRRASLKRKFCQREEYSPFLLLSSRPKSRGKSNLQL
jgi:hypothetical protein